MLILRALQDSEGSIWRCKLKNLHVVEITMPLSIMESEVRVDNVSNKILKNDHKYNVYFYACIR